MLDYLSQLALRVQQSEFAVQPRPVSRFESQYRTFYEPPASGEAEQLEAPSAVFIPDGTTAARYMEPVDNRIRREPEILDSIEAQSTRTYQNLYREHSTTTPPIMPPANSTETADLPVIEVAHLAPHRQQVGQSERITESVVAQAQSPVRIDKGASAAIVPSGGNTETTDSPVLEVPQSVLRRQQTEQSERIVRSTVAQAQPLTKIGRLEQQASKDSSNPLGRRDRSGFTDLVARRENEWRDPIVRIENPKGESAASLATRGRNHREIGTFSERTDTESLYGRNAGITTKSGSAPVPGREHPQPLDGPTDPQFGMAQATDAPTIQVTIGRVEIRATIASTPIRKAPTHTPAMSLDEYLKQRNGSRG